MAAKDQRTGGIAMRDVRDRHAPAEASASRVQICRSTYGPAAGYGIFLFKPRQVGGCGWLLPPSRRGTAWIAAPKLASPGATGRAIGEVPAYPLGTVLRIGF
ncbi:hypothetical protein FOMPIDRAFT_1045191 [Fomitopsis schrenkii]|uniref:Uncharacterized protein n=1 Tax=Fomitopsis schrenkii TaxID=2126942 RepID=S8EQ16_FOMSC|nr:hypothetical protein FOMPIDRAFT_1045191 [Fomitopsis schrenkii]